MPTARMELTAATANGKIYAIGGFAWSGPTRVPLNTVEVYDPATDTWSTAAPMLTARYGLAAATGPNGKIYVMGGYSGGPRSTVEAYDPVTNTWSTVAPLPTARHGLAAATGIDGRIYAIAGDTAGGGQSTNVVQAYDPSTNTWSPAAAIPTARASLAAAAAQNGRIYVIGGYTQPPGTILTTSEVYYPFTNTWSSAAPMPTARSGLGAGSGHDGRIYVIGGIAVPNPAMNTVEAYDPLTNTWSPASPMPTARCCFAVAVGPNGTTYALGGTDGVTWTPMNTVEAFTSSTDSTPPVITPTVSGTLGNNGWYRSDVTVSWSVTDPESPVTSTSGCVTTTLTADTAGVTLTCTATSAGGTASQSVTVKIDKTAPLLTASRSPAPNAAGWNNADVTVTFGCTDNMSGVASYSVPVVVTTEGANQSVPGSCMDGAGNTAALVVSGINIDKTAPLTNNTSAVPNPAPVNTGVTLSGDLSDSGGSNLASADYTINGAPGGTITASGATAHVSTLLAPFALTGVYQICLRARDVAGNLGASDCLLLPVYDPTGGFVTGGGWIMSPAGAYVLNPALSGKATFGFVSKYRPGATVPGGDTQFQFHAAAMKFQSAAYEWLVIAGARAQYKGSGTINGSGTYQFLLTAIDGDLPGGNGLDRFRIKIWGAGGIVYDNQMGADDQSDPTTGLGGGSIVIHRQ